jgi:hypothetical protein
MLQLVHDVLPQVAEGDSVLTAIQPPCKNLLVPTVFHNPWWLEAASDGEYHEVEVRSSHRVVARLPYIVKRRLNHFREIEMPELTHFLGPAFDSEPTQAANRVLRNYSLTKELLGQLGSFHSFEQRFHRDIQETMAFQAAGFRTHVDFTYEIAPRPVKAIWASLRDKTRNVIRRAQERMIVVGMDDPYAFEAYYAANLRARGLAMQYKRIGKICEAAISRNQGRILAAMGADGQIVAAIFVPWDYQAAYYLLSTRSVLTDNGAVSLLIWEAIQMATKAGLIFDFDGAGPSGNRLLYTGFGGAITPRYSVMSSPRMYRLARAACRYVGVL